MTLKTIFIYLLSLFALDQNSTNQQGDTTVIQEYLITYRNNIPEDTELKRKAFYDLNNNLLKEINYYKGQILKTIIYQKKDTFDLKNYSKKDDITYSLRRGNKEIRLYNGKLIDKIFYDKNENIIKDINYNINSNKRVQVTEEYIYLYVGNKKKIAETFLWNKEVVYEVKYKYNKDSLLIEKYFLRNKCCERNQPIPVDKIFYEYDVNKNLIKEIAVIDRNVKRIYKNRFNGYFNKIIITTYFYDDRGRLIEKSVYTPNFSENPNTKITELYRTPSSLSEKYFYKYN